MRRRTLPAALDVDCRGVVGLPGPIGPGGASVGATVSGATIAVPPPNSNAGEWLMPGRDYANSRYSDLAQITPANAKNLHVSWTFSTGVLRGHEGQPLVVGNTMYVDHAIPERRVRARPHAAGLSAQVEVPPRERAGGGRRRLLRRREPRRGVRRRKDRLQPARRTHRRGRRRDGHGAVAHEDGRHQQGRDDHHGAASS